MKKIFADFCAARFPVETKKAPKKNILSAKKADTVLFTF